jgi:hypothetical protein
MQEQNLKTHARLVPGFHFITAGIILISFIVAVIFLISSWFSLSSIFDVLAAISLGLLFAYLRVFATANQDRIIRAEENFRSYRLTGKMLEASLAKKQIVALRFASDEEFPSLCEKVVKENMQPSAIKETIRQWRADHHRV